MISKIITVFWISLLLSAIPCCCLYKSSPWECDSEEVESKPCIEALIRYGFKSEYVSDESNKIILPNHLFNIGWKKYHIDSTAFNFNNGKCQIFDKEIFPKQNVIVYSSTSQDFLSNRWAISIDEKFSYEELVKSLKSYSLIYENLKILWRVNYCFHMDNCKIEISYCNSLDKLPPPETFSMISQDLFSNILDCMEER